MMMAIHRLPYLTFFNKLNDIGIAWWWSGGLVTVRALARISVMVGFRYDNEVSFSISYTFFFVSP